MKEIICITGTGRSGTTFLMRLFTLLDLNTSYTKDDILNKHHINKECNSGLEKYSPNEKYPYIFKDPMVIYNAENFIIKRQITTFILPIRNYDESAKSRSKYKKCGGFCAGAKNTEEQTMLYHKGIAETIYYASKYSIDLIILNFDKMISDSLYLFNKTSFLLNNTTYENFVEKYNLTTELSKPNIAT